jgi:F-type H+-transporting ATPase subunit alpha
MATRGQDIASAIKREIDKSGTSLAMYDVGVVSEIGDGIARINGLASAKYSELLQFPNDIIGIAMNLEEDSIAAIIVDDYTSIKEGDEVRSTGRIAEVPTGDALIGRVVDPLGRPLDGKGPIKTTKPDLSRESLRTLPSENQWIPRCRPVLKLLIA